MTLLLLISVFILAYLAGRLTEDMGCLFATLGAVVVGFLLVLISGQDFGFISGGVDAASYWMGLLYLLFVCVPAILLNAAAGLAGYQLGKHHRPPPDED